MDTIRLKFRERLPNNDYFKEKTLTKEFNLRENRASRFIYSNQEWREKRKQKGFYTPRYWVEEDYLDPSITYLFVEFSAAKLLFGENATELHDHHLPLVAEVLSAFLREIGFYISSWDILKCKPILVAIGKNINLTGICSCDTAIKVLSPFDYKPHTVHRIVEFSDYKNRGREIIFSIKDTETFKIYSKTQEIINTASTPQEKRLAQALTAERYKAAQVYINEILRIEATYKTGRKIEEKFIPLLPKGQRVTFENIFKRNIWDKLIKNEMEAVFNHALKYFIFLANDSRPVIKAWAEKNIKHIETQDTCMGIISSLQEYGLKKTRLHYLEKYNSRQTWYNYFNRLKTAANILDFNSVTYTTNYQIYAYILSKCGVETNFQTNFDFTGLSKKIDVPLRNTRI